MARRRHKQQDLSEDIKLPPDETIVATATSLLTRVSTESTTDTKYAPVRHLLCLIGAGQAIDITTLSQYNPYYVKRTIKRLKKQELIEQQGHIYSLTTRGKRWILKYTLEDLQIPAPRAWDNKWRMVIYDVARHKAALRNIFRITIRRLGFYNVQESVWIHPYPCEKEISFLRDYCGMGSDVIYVIAHKIENDGVYKTHFGLK
jgi:phenylacetic acid degradation operon negative regulatory protein